MHARITHSISNPHISCRCTFAPPRIDLISLQQTRFTTGTAAQNPLTPACPFGGSGDPTWNCALPYYNRRHPGRQLRARPAAGASPWFITRVNDSNTRCYVLQVHDGVLRQVLLRTPGSLSSVDDGARRQRLWRSSWSDSLIVLFTAHAVGGAVPVRGAPLPAAAQPLRCPPSSTSRSPCPSSPGACSFIARISITD